MIRKTLVGIRSQLKRTIHSTAIFHNSNNFSKIPKMSKSLQEILQKLEEFAPLKYAEPWDNVGLLVDPMENQLIRNILLTNDLTEDVVWEAEQQRVGLIISYHPNIFQGLKSITSKTWKERIIVQCIKSNIAVFSPHTSWDAVRGGVNDWLTNAFRIKTSNPIIPIPDNPDIGAGRICTLEQPVTIQQAVDDIKRHIGVPHLRLALARRQRKGDSVSTVAFCAGSGSSVLRGVKADLYVTGEMLHHDVLDATQKGISVILCNHSDSERGFLKMFQIMLENDLLQNEGRVVLALNDNGPLQTV